MKKLSYICLINLSLCHLSYMYMYSWTTCTYMYVHVCYNIQPHSCTTISCTTYMYNYYIQPHSCTTCTYTVYYIQPHSCTTIFPFHISIYSLVPILLYRASFSLIPLICTVLIIVNARVNCVQTYLRLRARLLYWTTPI